jgi:CYTH domain-containing protein
MEEIELTYLAKELPAGLEDSPRKDLLDIYIPSSANHPVLRIRKLGQKCEITKKQPIDESDSSRQLETTIPLTEEEFGELSQLKGKRVHKTRYYYRENDVDYEIDVFRDDLAGLVLVDVEFASLEEKCSFVPPPWCLKEITQETFIAGGMICGKRYVDIEKDLDRFSYKKMGVG